MEKKKISYLVVLIVLVIALIIFAGVKNINNHLKKEYLVVNSKILESAKKCFLKQDCEGKITLKDLYDKEYLGVQVDPKTKINMDENICIEFADNNAVFCDK